ncbi:MAG: DUF2191 domain-containing protein [Polyangiales bacterium]
MKTTVEIHDVLFQRAKTLARAQNCSMRHLIEEGLRAMLQVHSRTSRYTLPDCSVGGAGLNAEAETRYGWKGLRELAYDDL